MTKNLRILSVEQTTATGVGSARDYTYDCEAMGMGSSPSRCGKGCLVYCGEHLGFGYLFLLFFISFLLIVFYTFLSIYIHSIVLHFILSLSSIYLFMKCKSHLSAMVNSAPISTCFYDL